MPTQVTLDRYAEIRAEMEAGSLRDEVLAHAGLSVDDWTAAQRHWLESMGAEIERGRFELTNRYSRAFLERQQALKSARAPIVAAPAITARAPLPIAEVAPRAIEAKPTFLAAGAAAEPPAPSKPVVRPPSPLLSGTMSIDISAFRPALPFDAQAQAAPPPPATPPTTPVVKRAPAALSGTSMGRILPKGPALPFAPSAPAAADITPSKEPVAEAPVAMGGAPAQPAVKRAPAALSGTSMGFAAPKGPALPFAAADAQPQTPAPATPAPATPAPASVPAVKRAPAALSGTSMGFVAPKGPALPFAKESAAPAPIAADSKPVAPTPAAAPAAPPPAPPGGSIERAPSPAAPEAPPNGLSLEQYASLCVELGTAPANAAETFRRYGLTAEQGHAVDAFWKKRVAADPGARAAFDRAYHAYKAWLDTARGNARGP